jgi:hypothetical protein
LAPILGMGSCFVMRELVRLGHIKNPQTHCYCYEPAEKVRTLLGQLGCPVMETRDTSPGEMSKVIHQFLSENCADPTFKEGFDLPLLLWTPDDIDLPHSTSSAGEFVTLPDGRVLPRSYLR